MSAYFRTRPLENHKNARKMRPAINLFNAAYTSNASVSSHTIIGDAQMHSGWLQTFLSYGVTATDGVIANSGWMSILSGT